MLQYLQVWDFGKLSICQSHHQLDLESNFTREECSHQSVFVIIFSVFNLYNKNHKLDHRVKGKSNLAYREIKYSSS